MTPPTRIRVGLFGVFAALIGLFSWQSARSQTQFETIWSCSRCGAELGRGAAPPNLTKCPVCGAFFFGGGANNGPLNLPKIDIPRFDANEFKFQNTEPPFTLPADSVDGGGLPKDLFDLGGSPSGSSRKGAAIAGAIVGGLLVIGLIVFIAIMASRQSSRPQPRRRRMDMDDL